MAARRSKQPARDFSSAFIGSVILNRDEGAPGDFPWSIPALARLRRLELHPKVTFLVGENGTGKSTLLEGIAEAAGFGELGGSKNFDWRNPREGFAPSEGWWSALGSSTQLVRGVRREKDGFFLRAESFFNVASRIEDLGVDLRHYGGKPLHSQSHGEAFLALATNRWAGEGLYLLDEPEAALSPGRQLALLRILYRQAEYLGSQFIIATHSPIILAYPGALISQLSADGVEAVEYEQTEHFQLTRDFLNNRHTYLRHVFSDQDPE